jgi:hypothetical protein
MLFPKAQSYASGAFFKALCEKSRKNALEAIGAALYKSATSAANCADRGAAGAVARLARGLERSASAPTRLQMVSYDKARR